MRFRLTTLFALTAALLAGCSPVNTTQTTYVLNSTPQHTIKRHTHASTLLVMPTDSSAIYNTTSMAYSTNHYQVDYYAKNSWADTPAHMLQPLIVQSLQNSHYYHAIITSAYLGRPSVILSTQLLELKQDYTQVIPLLHLVLRAQLLDADTNRVIATKLFSISEAMPQKSPYGGVVAANRATSQLLRKLTAFCVRH